MRNSGLFAAHDLEIENTVHLDAENSTPTTPKHSPNNAKVVCHPRKAVRQQHQNSSTAHKSSSPVTPEARSQATIEAAACSQQSSTKFLSKPYIVV